MQWIYDDGGRKAAGYNAVRVGDCATRAIAIATGKPYQEVYDDLNTAIKRQHNHKGRTARDGGANRRTTRNYMKSLGWMWTPAMSIGSGCVIHLRVEELPADRVIVSVSGHLTAVIDGVIHDTHDPSRDGQRCVYGYWTK